MKDNGASDAIKKTFGVSADELLKPTDHDHVTFHDTNAFCGNAGAEELKHLAWLLHKLSDEQLHALAVTLGLDFGDIQMNREDIEAVLDEASREDFYREYHKLIDDSL